MISSPSRILAIAMGGALLASVAFGQGDRRIIAVRLASLAKRCLIELPDPSYGIDGLRAAVKTDPTFEGGFILLASALYSSGDATASAAALENAAALETDPQEKTKFADMARGLRNAGTSLAPAKLGESTVFLPAGDPSFQKAFVNATLAERAGLFKVALKSLDEAIPKANAQQAKAMTSWREKLTDEIATADIRNQAIAAGRKQDYVGALSLWQQVVAKPFCTIDDINAYAMTADSGRQYVSAAVVLQSRAKDLEGDRKEAALRQSGRLRNRAVLYKQARASFEEAENLTLTDGIDVASVSYLAALQVDPFNSVYLCHFARSLKAAKKDDQAIKVAKLALNSNDEGPQLAIAISILDEAGLALDAEIPAQKILVESQTMGLPALEALAAEYGRQKNDKRVLTCFLKGDRPKLTKVGLSALGHAYFNLKDYAESEDCFRRQTQLDPKDSQAFADLAGTLLREQKIDEARSMAKQAIQLGLTKHWSYRELIHGK